jgi:hypothetical protein
MLELNCTFKPAVTLPPKPISIHHSQHLLSGKWLIVYEEVAYKKIINTNNNAVQLIHKLLECTAAQLWPW